MDIKLLFGDLIILVAIAVAQLRLGRQLSDQQATIAKLVARLGVELDSPLEPSDAVRELAKNPDQYIVAIRAYRQETGAGLKEAKAVVDKLTRAGSPPAASSVP
jgi:ribosomal protein L7/L12